MNRWIQPLWDLALNRYPIKITTRAHLLPDLTVAVDIANQTPNIPVFVHAVRVHFGNKLFNRSFGLIPHDVVELRPKARSTWFLSYAPGDLQITVRRLTKEPPKPTQPTNGPGIDTPDQLFDAIRFGDRAASWVEVDFNEYRNRQFLIGHVKDTFVVVGAELDKRISGLNAEPPRPAEPSSAGAPEGR